jgi:hypothetical protein
VPDYQPVDRDPRWHRWLLGIDNLSGRVRQTLLNEAIAAGDPHRVKSFFDGFRREVGGTQSSAATRTTSNRTKSLGSRIYSREDIGRLYEKHRKGEFTEAAWAKIEADIFAAQHDGRIAGIYAKLMALVVFNAEIPAGEALSTALDCRSVFHLVRIGMPMGWNAAPLTFQTAQLPLYDTPPDDQDYLNLYHAMQSTNGDWMPYEVRIPTILPGSLLSLPPDTGFSLGWLRLRSGTRQTPVIQQVSRTFTLVFDSM